MRLHRFIGPFDLSRKSISVTDPEFLNQWRNVLRLRTGDSVILCDGNGTEAEARIERADRDEFVLSPSALRKLDSEPERSITLYASLLKRENFELVAQKATELGITRIIPVISERTVKTGLQRERLERIIREAAEQSGRGIVPELQEALSFEEAVTTAPKDSILFDLSGESVPATLGTTAVFIGPEGGFSEKEVALAQEHGMRVMSLGTRTLRAETAALVVSYLSTR